MEKIVWDWRKENKGTARRWISYEEEAKLLALVPANIAKLIKVAIANGCRRGELLSAKPEHVTDDTLIVWKSKNDDRRSVPLDRETAQMLQELVGGEMPSIRTLRRRWDEAKSKMGLSHDKGFVFHSLRHTCATRMVSADIDALVIQKWLGHKRIETTQLYAKVNSDKLRSVLHRVGELRATATATPAFLRPPASPTSTPQVGGLTRKHSPRRELTHAIQPFSQGRLSSVGRAPDL